MFNGVHGFIIRENKDSSHAVKYVYEPLINNGNGYNKVINGV